MTLHSSSMSSGGLWAAALHALSGAFAPTLADGGADLVRWAQYALQ